MKSEGGNKRGHSQMSHWFPTAEVKERASVARRAARRAVRLLKKRMFWREGCGKDCKE
jgi:hypothetical protein